MAHDMRDWRRMMERAQPVPLGKILRAIARQPLDLLRDWNWKAALVSAVIRSLLFFVTNRHAGRNSALKAMVVELVFATFAAGLAGAVTQRLRHAAPRAVTALVVWGGVPVVMLLAQAALHHAMGTPRLRASLIASFAFGALANGFNWFAMSRGAFVTGEDRPFLRDLALAPRLLWQFLMTPVRLRFRDRDGT